MCEYTTWSQCGTFQESALLYKQIKWNVATSRGGENRNTLRPGNQVQAQVQFNFIGKDEEEIGDSSNGVTVVYFLLQC